VATLGVDSGAVVEVWSGQETCGEYFPEVSGLPGHDPLVVLESRREPPTLGVLGASGFRQVLAAVGPGTTYQAERAGSTTYVTWQSSDGLQIAGLLTVPAGGARPHPLVLQVHGGPTHACRNTWIGRDPHTSCLVARGYAVLQPNPRGSTGRGAAFAEAVRGDMGGLDADDLVSGVQSLVDVGIADPSQLGITGISYGGFMSSWVPVRTGLFAASVARSPCTDWLLQHLTSNIAEFDRRFVGGNPFDPESHYCERSPLRHVDRIRTPMLLTAGLKDLATPPSQAQVLYTALRERGIATELVLYPEEGHGVRHPPTIVDQCARMIAWFERYLTGELREDGN
jgi:dipeptidyl aminopeptidase/acylaminoacyl peptidase